MSPFWQGFFSVFGYKLPKKKLPSYEPFQWYHDGPWYEHPIYTGRK